MSSDLLTDAPRCLLGYAGRRWPVVTPMAFWSDGTAVWMTTSGSASKTAALRADPSCALYVPPLDEGGEGVAADGLRIDGRARVFGPHDPVGLVLHGPTLSAVAAAYSVKHAGSVVGYARDVARVPPRWLPAGRVIVKITIDRLRRARPPRAAPGIAPPLPPVVPPDVRRGVGGRRDVVLAVAGADGLELGPARLGSGFVVDTGPVWTPAPGAASLVVEAPPSSRPTAVSGLRLSGELGEAGRFTARRATWWNGFDLGSADVPERPVGVVLPD